MIIISDNPDLLFDIFDPFNFVSVWVEIILFCPVLLFHHLYHKSEKRDLLKWKEEIRINKIESEFKDACIKLGISESEQVKWKKTNDIK